MSRVQTLAGLTLGRTFAAFVIYMTFIVFHIIFHIHVWVGWVGEINMWTDGTAVASNLHADIRAGNSNEWQVCTTSNKGNIFWNVTSLWNVTWVERNNMEQIFLWKKIIPWQEPDLKPRPSDLKSNALPTTPLQSPHEKQCASILEYFIEIW